ncbi:hypothetical protein D0864_04545 [Hortaea werneckii]|uniref:EVE domain-containing protein n=1 Tax=Hortaea werneckii TaxID=91943 RepID=A0A3M7GB17_HORWE|nr:hypothetical protein KC352_g12712 [Hortaea werneckii]KAI7565871.1 hypothetical protein KC317_g6063 [Hortaea werneckii]KAI7617055.1 hypothetical protein KC346_g5679 [Hortaea werneckii]KAI7706681.1 hypothetical protein KC322_g5785 [Hortaea werneckii]RMY98007.1 hypothetical protein D0864_04545 [Hortaea werneckii]
MPPKNSKAAATSAGKESSAAREEVPASVASDRKQDTTTTATTQTAAAPTKKRGRPAKSAEQETQAEDGNEAAEPPKKRGRPPKEKKTEAPEEATEPLTKPGRASAKASSRAPEQPAETTEKEQAETKPKRGRGRPRKILTEEEIKAKEAKKSRGRGRPRKILTEKEQREKEALQKAKEERAKAREKAGQTYRGRGRPKKIDTAKEKPATKDEAAPPHKRGEPPHGGESNYPEADRDQAEEQLEDELLDEVERSDKKASGTRKSTNQGPDRAPADRNKPPRALGAQCREGSAKMYWLMKAEQEDREEKAPDGSSVNVKFTIDDLREKGEPELWDGVRNYAAANNMREMKKGDLAFFYASGGKKGRTPGIVGIMEVVQEARPDPSASQKSSPYFEEDEKKREKWICVSVEYRKKLTKPVSLAELKKYSTDGDGPLSDMDLFTKARQSVSKVSAQEWKFITEVLIEGYEENDDDLDDDDDDAEAGAAAKMNNAIAGALADGAAAADDLAAEPAEVVTADSQDREMSDPEEEIRSDVRESSQSGGEE